MSDASETCKHSMEICVPENKKATLKMICINMSFGFNGIIHIYMTIKNYGYTVSCSPKSVSRQNCGTNCKEVRDGKRTSCRYMFLLSINRILVILFINSYAPDLMSYLVF